MITVNEVGKQVAMMKQDAHGAWVICGNCGTRITAEINRTAPHVDLSFPKPGVMLARYLCG